MSLGAAGGASAQNEPFDVYLADLEARAIAKGYARPLVKSVLTLDAPATASIELDQNQSEFVRPIWQYLASAVSESRIETGRARAQESAALLVDLQARYGVQAESLVAVWGLESAFGDFIGTTDVPLALVTLAWEGRRRAFFESELFAVMDIIAAGEARREELVGGWAGAMGQTQFMPSAYRIYAVDYDGDGGKDVWANRGDALASAANYLAEKGWVAGEPWGLEVELPADFDFGLADGRRATVGGWASKGVVRADHAPWDANEQFYDAQLLAPAGARGPAFLLFNNFNVFKRYNASTSYALAAGLLSDAIAGRPGVKASWPVDERPLAREEVKTIQRALTALGHDTQGVDGVFGPNSQGALRAWQRSKGLAADAFPTAGLHDALVLEAGFTPAP